MFCGRLYNNVNVDKNIVTMGYTIVLLIKVNSGRPKRRSDCLKHYLKQLQSPETPRYITR